MPDLSSIDHSRPCGPTGNNLRPALDVNINNVPCSVRKLLRPCHWPCVVWLAREPSELALPNREQSRSLLPERALAPKLLPFACRSANSWNRSPLRTSNHRDAVEPLICSGPSLLCSTPRLSKGQRRYFWFHILGSRGTERRHEIM